MRGILCPVDPKPFPARVRFHGQCRVPLTWTIYLLGIASAQVTICITDNDGRVGQKVGTKRDNHPSWEVVGGTVDYNKTPFISMSVIFSLCLSGALANATQTLQSPFIHARSDLLTRKRRQDLQLNAVFNTVTKGTHHQQISRLNSLQLSMIVCPCALRHQRSLTVDKHDPNTHH
ncbi:hypothetical protein BaRGS_00033648 [Batillaria attramentaria]|uniref:Uncharacterized protein n=1 Tax=Batillaria attramentaria TaxID=370345 RepID=A0ABD0JKC2_9CAEN